MPSDGTIQSPQPKPAEQAPTSTPASTPGSSPVRTGIPPSAVTRPPIDPHQGHPENSSSTGSSHSAIHSSSGSSSPGLHKQPKPQNVFSNDGSFLERFQRLKREEDEKRKERELLERRKQFADRFKNRGKRDYSEVSEPSSSGSALGCASGGDGILSPGGPSKPKKVKLDQGVASHPSSLESKPLSMDEYQKEMQTVNTESLKGGGIGVRPLTK